MNKDFNKEFSMEDYYDKLDDTINNIETFYVYVTGICDCGSMILGKPYPASFPTPHPEFYSYVSKWINGGIRNLLLSYIPERFKKIKIRYFDNVNKDENHMVKFDKIYIDDYINYLHENLINEDNKNPRFNSKFYNKWFPSRVISENNTNSYIVIDLAHIFKVSNESSDLVSLSYSFNQEDTNDEQFKLKTIYPDDVYDNYFKYDNSFIDKEYIYIHRPFIVNSDNSVKTYYDILRDNNKKIGIDNQFSRNTQIKNLLYKVANHIVDVKNINPDNYTFPDKPFNISNLMHIKNKIIEIGLNNNLFSIINEIKKEYDNLIWYHNVSLETKYIEDKIIKKYNLLLADHIEEKIESFLEK